MLVLWHKERLIETLRGQDRKSEDPDKARTTAVEGTQHWHRVLDIPRREDCQRLQALWQELLLQSNRTKASDKEHRAALNEKMDFFTCVPSV